MAGDDALGRMPSTIPIVVPHDELLPFTRELARAAVGNDQVGVRRMLATYDEIAATIFDEGWEVERRVNRAWLSGGIDAAEVGRRRDAIIERGRDQDAALRTGEGER